MSATDDDVLGRIVVALERQAAATERLANVAERAPGVVRVAGVGKTQRTRRARALPNVEATDLDRARARRELRRLGLVKP